MHNMLTALLSDLGLSSTTEGDAAWLRADGRFDIHVSWVNDEHTVQLTTVVQPAGQGWNEPPPVADDGEWCDSSSVRGPWRHRMVWHLPSSFVALTARAEARTLDAVALPEFIGGFIDHAASLGQVFDEAAENR
jgi:hypothetical protein